MAQARRKDPGRNDRSVVVRLVDRYHANPASTFWPRCDSAPGRIFRDVTSARAVDAEAGEGGTVDADVASASADRWRILRHDADWLTTSSVRS